MEKVRASTCPRRPTAVMPQVIEYNGQIHQVPDDTTDEEIGQILSGAGPGGMPPAVKAEGLEEVFPVVSTYEQAKRDSLAAKLRGREVGNSPEEIQKAVDDLESALLKRPMNGSVRKMLKRELSFWKTLQEQQSAD